MGMITVRFPLFQRRFCLARFARTNTRTQLVFVVPANAIALNNYVRVVEMIAEAWSFDFTNHSETTSAHP